MEKLEENNLEPILDSIMSAEEYAHLRHQTPYVFELRDGDKELHYFGAAHSRDPKNPLFSEIEQSFNEANPDIVFVEGINLVSEKSVFNEKVKVTSREEIIDQMGEPGFALKLALEKGLDWVSPEPTDRDLYNFLLEKGFSREEIFAWSIIQMLPQYHRQMNKSGFKEYVNEYVGYFKEATNWEDFEYSYDNAIKIVERIIGRPIDVENEPTAVDFIDPIPWEKKKDKQTKINRAGEMASLFRDRKIVDEIANAIKKYKKVFVVYGASHAVMQEPALKKLMAAEA